MITRNLLLTIILIVGIARMAHSQNNCNQPPCQNGTNTNPNSPYTSPQTGDFRQNTFNWRDATFPVDKSHFEIFSPVGSSPYLNPFVAQADYLFGLGSDKLDIGRDNRPEDGWELIKQDFGYAYNNGQWNGTRMPIIENNQIVIAEQSILNYFILYNKYTGVLRVLGSHPNQSNGYKGIVVHIEIVHSLLPNFAGKSNYNSYKSNGLFALNSTISTALDKQTKNLVISALAISPTTNAQFFYADFQMSYDPCICLFEGGLRFSFETLRTADITMAGKAIGANVDVAKLNPNGGSLNFVSLGFNPQIAIGNINENGSDREAQVQSIMQHYQDLEKLISKMESAGATSIEIDEIKKGLKLIGVVATGGKLIALKTAVETMSKFIDFGTYDETKNKTKFKSSVVTSYLELVGQVVTRLFQNGTEFYLATPGSCGAESRDEYTKQDNNGTIPMYPMYNEPLGLFALMTTPKININHRFDSETIGPANINGNGSQQCSGQFPSNQFKTATNFRETYKLPQGNGFDFAFHPIVDSEKTYIDAAIEVYNVDDFFNCLNNNVTTNKFSINCEKIDAKNSIGRYRTDFFPLQCIEEVVFQVGHSYSGDRGKHDELHSTARSKAFIIFNIYYVFKEDVYGKVHTTVQSIKYPLELVETTDDLSLHPNFSLLSTANQGDLIIPATVYQTGQIIFTNGNITITGNQINQLSVLPPWPFAGNIPEVKFLATGNITIEPGVEIGQRIVLESGVHPGTLVCLDIDDKFKPKLKPMTPAMLISHCNSTNYKAKEVAPAAFGLPPSQSISQQNSRFNIKNKASISPNPNTGSFAIEFDNDIELDANLTVHDITGREVYNNILAKNKNYFTIENTKLTSGIYFVSITNNNEKQTFKIIIQN